MRDEGDDEYDPKELMVNDVSRAYFYAPVKRSLFIELPSEDKEAKEGEVGRLNVSLYGTRDAAHNCTGTGLSVHMAVRVCSGA